MTTLTVGSSARPMKSGFQKPVPKPRFVIAAQIARIVHPDALWQEIAAAVGRIVPREFLDREFLGYCSTLMRRARAAFATRQWSKAYHLPKSYMIEALKITSDEMPHMRALIDEAEYLKRHAARGRKRRTADGAVERGAYEARGADRRATARPLRCEGLSWGEVGERMGVSATATRLRARRDEKAFRSVR